MMEFLEQFRRQVEKHWDEETVSSQFTPIDETKPKSLGQCTPTSYVLIDELRSTDSSKNFTLSIGEVRLEGRVVIPYHVWVVEITDSPKNNKIVDVTADQSEVLPEIIYESVKSLAERGVEYIAYEQSHQKSFIKDEAVQRAGVLGERYHHE